MSELRLCTVTIPFYWLSCYLWPLLSRPLPSILAKTILFTEDHVCSPCLPGSRNSSFGWASLLLEEIYTVNFDEVCLRILSENTPSNSQNLSWRSLRSFGSLQLGTVSSLLFLNNKVVIFELRLSWKGSSLCFYSTGSNSHWVGLWFCLFFCWLFRGYWRFPWGAWECWRRCNNFWESSEVHFWY